MESNGSLPPGLWLTSPAGWLPRTGICCGTPRLVVKYGLCLPFSAGVYAGACPEWCRTTSTARCCLVLVALPSSRCRSVHSAVSATSTTPTSALPTPFVSFTHSCERRSRPQSDDWRTYSFPVSLHVRFTCPVALQHCNHLTNYCLWT